MSKSIPQTITFDEGKIYGVLRKPTNSNKLFVILPASSGTRIGPQRIFVEIARALYNIGISSICVDLPPLGDSFSNKEFKSNNDYFKWLSEKYEYYIKLIIEDVSNNSDFNEINLMSISYGCIPCYSYAINNDIKRLVLLSPDHIIGSVEKINKKNIKSYYYKLFKKDTWLKLISFQLNYTNIYKNIFSKRHIQKKQVSDMDILNNELDILSVFGEKDRKIDVFIKYWREKVILDGIKKYQYKIVENSDHSFFGWQIKRNVEKQIIDWITY